MPQTMQNFALSSVSWWVERGSPSKVVGTGLDDTGRGTLIYTKNVRRNWIKFPVTTIIIDKPIKWFIFCSQEKERTCQRSNRRNHVLVPAGSVFRRRSAPLTISAPKEGFVLNSRRRELSVVMAVRWDTTYVTSSYEESISFKNFTTRFTANRIIKQWQDRKINDCGLDSLVSR